MNDPFPTLTQALSDRYQVERELGAGGMATVFLAHDRKHERQVAIKVLRPELAAVVGAERFLHEIKVIAHLQHPHILGLIDSGHAGELVYYVMPYVDGESLRARLAREKQLPVEDAVRIVTHVASALDYAHRHGVIHRDIKPENILLHDRQALVADFGIALALSKAEGGTRLTETGLSLGTPHYMSPEQAMGERVIDARSDVYALGCVLYEMLTGEPPFTGATAQAVVAKMMTDAPRPPRLFRRTIAPQVEAATLRALEKLPADRFQSAAAFGAALEGVGPVTVSGTSPVVTLPNRRSWMLLVPWLVAAGAVAVALWSLVRSPRAAPVVAYLSIRLPAPLDRFAFAISPDARAIAYVARTASGPRLLVRRLEDPDFREVLRSENAEEVIFSPDSRWVAFCVGGRLRKAPAAGGSTVDLGDGCGGGYRGNASMTWADDGAIYSSDGFTIVRWPENGGSPQPVPVPTSEKGTLYGGMVALPGGALLYNHVASGQPLAIRGLQPGSDNVITVLDSAFALQYLGSGHLLAFRNAGLEAIPFDTRRLRTRGLGIRIATATPPGVGYLHPAVRVSDVGTLLQMPDSIRIELALTDRSGARHSLGAAVLQPAPRFSPDGRRIAFIQGDNVWVRDLVTGVTSRLTFGRDAHPSWTPDGRRIAYSSNPPLFDLFWRAADGSGKEDTLFAGEDQQRGEISWTADGRRAVFRQRIEAKPNDLWLLELGPPRAARPLLNSGFDEKMGIISPDGHFLAYVSNETGRDEVYVQDFPGLGGKRQISDAGGLAPRWSPTGRELFYIEGDQLMAVEWSPNGMGRREGLFRIPFTQNDLVADYDVHPDGRRFVIPARDDVTHLEIIFNASQLWPEAIRPKR